nr:MAG TPA: hypothetical protein [Caudoviricetes sp.]
MYLPALGPSKTNASPPPTNDGVKVGNSSTVKSQEGGMVAKGGKRVQILYSPCHMSLTSQAHEDSHGVCVIPLSVPTVKHRLLTLY